MRRKTGPAFLLSVGSGPPACQVSWGKPCAAGATPPKPGVECLSQFISSHEPESRMRENRPSGLGGGRRSDPFSIHIKNPVHGISQHSRPGGVLYGTRMELSPYPVRKSEHSKIKSGSDSLPASRLLGALPRPLHLLSEERPELSL